MHNVYLIKTDIKVKANTYTDEVGNPLPTVG